MSTVDRRLHERALQLAASDIDFALGRGEAAELEAHLIMCPACARSAAALRTDASAIRLPALLPSRRVDDAVYAAIARRDGGSQRLLVLVAAALLLVALLGIAAAGAFLLQARPLQVVVPSPSLPVVVVNPSPSGSPAPSVAPAPSSRPSPGWTPAPGALPVGAAGATAQLAAGPDGGAYVLVSTGGDAMAGRAGRTVLALIDASGNPRSGWPIAVDGWTCDTPNGSEWPPETAGDGTATVVCRSDESSDGSVRTSVSRFDAAGRLVGSWSHQGEVAGRPRIVDGRLLLVFSEVAERDVTLPDGQVETRSVVVHWLQEVAENGTVRSGARVEMGDHDWHVVMGPDGTAYHENMADGEVTAFDMDGQRAGWPVRLDGALSTLGFGSDGRVLVSAAATGTSRLYVLGRDGTIVARSDPLAIDGASAWSGAGPDGRPLAPLLAPDGTAFVVGEGDGHGVVYRIDPSGTVMAGWPHRAATELEWQGVCPPDVTGCGVWRSVPAVGPDGVVYLPLAAPDAQIGGSLAAVGPDGQALRGWPMHLARRGAAFWSAVPASDGTLYALAIEPETGGKSSATILAISMDGTVLSRTTVVQP